MPRRISQLPNGNRPGCEAIFDSSFITDIVAELKAWNAERALLVYSKSLAAQTSTIKDLEQQLGDLVVGKKAGVGAHSPYADVIEIAHLLHECDADVLVSIGSGSYSDACKVARLMHATLPPNFTASDMEALVNQKTGRAPSSALTKPEKVKLILVPTSLSAGEWNFAGSCTNDTGKKQHFGMEPGCAPDLILLDPKVALTAPEQLWLASGFRAIDHCVECLCNHAIDDHPDAIQWAEHALQLLIEGLVEYKKGKSAGGDQSLLEAGISRCQEGSRDALMPFVIYRNPMGPSHAIGHQVGSVGRVMHGVTSSILLAKVLRFTKSKNPKAQAKVLDIFNKTMHWQETEAADAVERFVKTIDLPDSLTKVGVTDDAQIERCADRALTDVWGGSKRQLEREDIMKILQAAR